MPEQCRGGGTHIYKADEDDNREFKMECNEEIKTLKRTQEKMKMGMQSPTAQLENLRESLPSRMNKQMIG